MNKQSLNKHIAFIISAMMFSVMPALVTAQKKCPDGNCPQGKVCLNGVCVKSGSGGGYCNCSVRPIPYGCGQICGWRTTTATNNPGSQSVAISFFLEMPKKISVKIFDMTGRWVKTLADNFFDQGEHTLQWDAAGVNEGIYIVQLNAGAYSETKKIAVIK